MMTETEAEGRLVTILTDPQEIDVARARALHDFLLAVDDEAPDCWPTGEQIRRWWKPARISGESWRLALTTTGDPT